VIAREVRLAGDGFIVAQQEHVVLIAVEQVPSSVEKDLGDAMAHRPRGGDPIKAGLMPQSSQTDRIVAAGVVAVDVEYLDRIAEFGVQAAEMVAVADFLEPQGQGLFLVGHARRDGRGDDLVDRAE